MLYHVIHLSYARKRGATVSKIVNVIVNVNDSEGNWVEMLYSWIW